MGIWQASSINQMLLQSIEQYFAVLVPREWCDFDQSIEWCSMS